MSLVTQDKYVQVLLAGLSHKTKSSSFLRTVVTLPPLCCYAMLCGNNGRPGA